MIFIPIVIGLAVGGGFTAGLFQGEKIIDARKAGRPERLRKAAKKFSIDALDMSVASTLVADAYQRASLAVRQDDAKALRSIAAEIATTGCKKEAKLILKIAAFIEEEQKMKAPKTQADFEAEVYAGVAASEASRAVNTGAAEKPAEEATASTQGEPESAPS